jgi:hypothetical protein
LSPRAQQVSQIPNLATLENAQIELTHSHNMLNLGMILLVFAGNMAAATLLMQGVYQSTEFKRPFGGDHDISTTGNVTIVCDNDRYRITVTPDHSLSASNKETNLVEAATILSYDSTNLYQLTTLAYIEPDGKQTVPISTAKSVYLSGVISTGPVPQRCDLKLSLIWLATASGPYLIREQSHSYLPMFLPPPQALTSDSRLKVTAVRTLEQTWPHLPITFYSTDLFWDSDDAEYRETEKTNLVLFAVNNGGVRNVTVTFLHDGNIPRSKIQISLTNSLGLVHDPNMFSPVINGVATISDQRLMREKSTLALSLISSNWPSLESTTRRLKDLERLRSADGGIPENVKRIGIVSMFLLLIGIPISIKIWRQ